MEMRNLQDNNDQEDIDPQSLHPQVLGTQPQRGRSVLLHMAQMGHSDQEPCKKNLQKRVFGEQFSFITLILSILMISVSY